MKPTRAATTALSLAAAVLLGAIAGCSDDPSGPITKTDANLNVVLQAPTAPSLAATTKSVLVTRGQNAELRLYYRPRAGSADSSEFLRLRFEDNTLLARPDGTPIAIGESVLVTATVPDPTKFLVTLEPSGLRFNPNDPADLKWKLGESEDDLDDDGDVDAADSTLFRTLGIWRQETIGAPWTRLASRLEVQLNEIEAELTGFSNYVVAY
jgi:hypothetical protein